MSADALSLDQRIALPAPTVSGRAPAARGESLAAFDGRCIPAGGVAPRSHTAGMLGRRALPAGRLARLGATPDFHHGLPADPSMTEVDDAGLVEQCLAGDCGAFDVLVERHRRQVYQVCYRFVG